MITSRSTFGFSPKDISTYKRDAIAFNPIENTTGNLSAESYAINFLQNETGDPVKDYPQLKLSKGKYDSLLGKNFFGKKHVLVFQFTYIPGHSFPTLTVYVMKRKHRKTFSDGVTLDYYNPTSTTKPNNTDSLITGDLQIKIKKITQLKKVSNPGNPEGYQYLIFTPKYDASNLHVYYDVSVSPSANKDISATTRTLNPSPPSGAN